MEVIREAVRVRRRNPTPSERVLWQILRNRKLDGWRFHREYRIAFDYKDCKRFFIADFYCPAVKLVPEVDGGIHEWHVDYDNFRTAIIEQLGLRVMRIKNEELKDIAMVKARICEKVNES